MSMVLLGKRGIPKGGMTCQVKLATLAYLVDHGGEWTSAQLQKMLYLKGIEVNSPVFSSVLSKLRAKGLISKRFNQLGVLVWFAGTEDWTAAQAKATGARDAAGLSDTSRHYGIPAAPRQNDVMHGPVYVPPQVAAHRAGSMDHLQSPSRVGGVRLAYRSGL